MAENLDKSFDKTGLWSPHTANNDWCEENYDVTFYVAEFWNTLTNLAFIINAIIGLRQAAKDQAERRVFVTYLALLVVGFGSWSFHMTLRYTMQMADQIPMLWLMTASFFCIWEAKAPSRPLSSLTAVFLLLITMIASVSTLMFQHVIYFQVTFAVYLAIYFLLCIRALWSSQNCNRTYMRAAVFWLILAFSVWIVDRNFCPQLRSVRYMLPWFLQPLLQFHALWHIFSNLGCAFNIVFVYDMRCRYLHQASRQRIIWGVFPYLEVHVKKDIP